MDITNLTSEVSKAYRDQDEMVVKMSPDSSEMHDPGLIAWDRKYEKQRNKQATRAGGAALAAGGLAVGGAKLMESKRPALRRVVGPAGIAAGVGTLGYAAHQAYTRPKVKLSKRTWSEKELGQRKKVQAGLALGGSTAGLTSLGLLGASALAKKKPGLIKVNPEKLRNASINTGIGAGGVGGIGGLHFASLQNQEVKRRALDKVNAQRQLAEVRKSSRSEQRKKRGDVIAGAGGAAVLGGGGMVVGGHRAALKNTRINVSDWIRNNTERGETPDPKLKRLRPGVSLSDARYKARVKRNTKEPGQAIGRPRKYTPGGKYYKISGPGKVFMPMNRAARGVAVAGVGAGLASVGAGVGTAGLNESLGARQRMKRNNKKVSKAMSSKEKDNLKDLGRYAGMAAGGGTLATLGARGVTRGAVVGRVARESLRSPRPIPARVLGSNIRDASQKEMFKLVASQRIANTMLGSGATLGAVGGAGSVEHGLKAKDLHKKKPRRSRVAKADWKTIDYREQKAAGARKKRRRAETAMTTGLGLGAGSLVASQGTAVKQARNFSRGVQNTAKLTRAKVYNAKGAAQSVKALSQRNPYGAILVGSGALTAGGAGAWGAARATEARHQHKINAKRRENLTVKSGTRR